MFFYILSTFIVGIILGAAFMYCDQLEKTNDKLTREVNRLISLLQHDTPSDK